jgi:transcriptional regulator with XRE-family HTH domain
MDVVVESGEGTCFRDLRQALGLTLQQVANATGFSLSHLSNVERGARRATEHLVRVYANLASIAIQSPPCPVTPISSHAANPISAQPDSSDDFGTRLLRLRLSRGLSLAELSAATHVSKSYLGNLERGRKHPSAAVAAACDNELAAGGALITLRMAPIGSARTDMPIPAPSTERFRSSPDRGT